MSLEQAGRAQASWYLRTSNTTERASVAPCDRFLLTSRLVCLVIVRRRRRCDDTCRLSVAPLMATTPRSSIPLLRLAIVLAAVRCSASDHRSAGPRSLMQGSLDSADSDIRAGFTRWKEDFGAAYGTAVEEAERYQAFAESAQVIADAQRRSRFATFRCARRLLLVDDVTCFQPPRRLLAKKPHCPCALSAGTMLSAPTRLRSGCAAPRLSISAPSSPACSSRRPTTTHHQLTSHPWPSRAAARAAQSAAVATSMYAWAETVQPPPPRSSSTEETCRPCHPRRLRPGGQSHLPLTGHVSSRRSINPSPLLCVVTLCRSLRYSRRSDEIIVAARL